MEDVYKSHLIRVLNYVSLGCVCKVSNSTDRQAETWVEKSLGSLCAIFKGINRNNFLIGICLRKIVSNILNMWVKIESSVRLLLAQCALEREKTDVKSQSWFITVLLWLLSGFVLLYSFVSWGQVAPKDWMCSVISWTISKAHRTSKSSLLLALPPHVISDCSWVKFSF